MAITEIEERNRELAQKLLDDAKADPKSPYLGRFVGIANGRVVVVADDWDELARRLRQAEPDPSKTLSVEVGRDYSQIHKISSLV
jgi:hypothetical protein